MQDEIQRPYPGPERMYHRVTFEAILHRSRPGPLSLHPTPIPFHKAFSSLGQEKEFRLVREDLAETNPTQASCLGVSSGSSDLGNQLLLIYDVTAL